MKKITPPSIIILLLSSVALHSCKPATPKPAPTVRIGHLNLVTSLPLFIAQEKNFLTAQDIKFEAIPLATSNQLADALIAGDLDCYIGASVVPVFAAELNSPGKMKVFTVSEITPLQPFDALLVKVGSHIKTLSDLSGKKIAVFPGSTATNLLKKYLRDRGLDVSNITFIELPPSAHLSSLSIGFVDAVHAYEPTIALSKGGVKKLHGSVYADLLSPNPISVSVVSTEFLKNHPKTAAKTIAALERACKFMKENDKETRSILQKQMAISTTAKTMAALKHAHKFMKENDKETRSILQKQMALSKDVANAANRCSLLYMLPHDQLDSANFQRFADILTELGEIEKRISTTNILYR